MTREALEASAGPIEAPLTRHIGRELRAVGEFPRLALSAPELLRQPRGGGAPVLVLPGFGAGDGSTLVLRSYLRSLGYDARGWGLGRNHGGVHELVPQVIEKTLTLSEFTHRPVRLVGWSLGGVLARETARQHPDCVHSVITMGTPVVGGPKYTLAADAYRRRGVDLDAIEREVEEVSADPIRVPITAFFSKSDGVVAWRACLDRHNPQVRHIEVDATHTGLGFHAPIFAELSRRLAEDFGDDG